MIRAKSRGSGMRITILYDINIVRKTIIPLKKDAGRTLEKGCLVEIELQEG